MKVIISWLNDSDRFRLRGLSLLFYESYYCQQINERTKPFNDERAIKLAKRGRVFTKVFHLQTRYVSISPKDIQHVSPYTFPNLQSFSSDKSLTKREFHRLRHPRLIKLYVILDSANLVKYITEERFPKLEVLDIECRQRVPSLGAVYPHKVLRTLRCSKVELNENFFDSINRKHFPKMRIVEIGRRMNFSGIELSLLQSQFRMIDIELKNI